MSVAKVRACSSPDAMMPEQKTVKPEKVGQDPLDNFIKQAIGKEPFLSFSGVGDNPVQWIQLLHALDQQGSSKVSKCSKADNGVGGREHSLELCNCLSSEINGVKEFVHPRKDAGAPPKEKKSTSEQLQTLKLPEAVVAFAQAAAKANDLPRWPLVSPSKVQLLKCDKCSREFCSSINYRRHVRVHRRSLNNDKDSSSNREFLAAFWDKLCLDEAKEIMSLTDVAIEEVAGSAIIRALSSWIRKPGFSYLPQKYVKAGATLLDVVQSKPSRFLMSSKELFDVLDEASEKTFLRAGTAMSLQKFVLNGEAGKIALEMKNLVACTSFLLEQKLVKAWLADKDAEALRCQKLLVEEEEAARKRQAGLLERKRTKKLRQKEQKAKDFTDADNRVHSPGTMEYTSGSTGTPSPRAPSESDLYAQEASIDQDPQSLEPTGSPDPVADTNFRLHVHTEDADQNMDHLKQMENCRRQPTVTCYLLSKPSRNFRSGFYSGQVPVAKSSISMKHGTHKDPKAATSANWNKIWTRKFRPDSEEAGSSDRVDREHRDQPVIIDNSEVLIGSISVTLGQSNDCCQDSSSPCCSHYQEKLVKPDSSMNDVNCSGARLWKPVACQDNCDYAIIRSDKRENKMDRHATGTAISPDQSCLASGGMDGAGSERCKDLLALHRSANLSGPLLFSVKDAEAFLAQNTMFNWFSALVCSSGG
ncbi:uncharacterized protein LOC103698622 isoform X2 [Phoenix dactylifera]|uniref:Uncharacterized protein LOC103698622 isoform X2 n=1 Tax=Phoenix dactylifera TaxID=42345 RepID=A0A8B8ZB45_PHODC|nr:uncharacterized protein LOC103698622 isoform X2 [Phoenix dactylifera]